MPAPTSQQLVQAPRDPLQILKLSRVRPHGIRAHEGRDVPPDLRIRVPRLPESHDLQNVLRRKSAARMDMTQLTSHGQDVISARHSAIVADRMAQLTVSPTVSLPALTVTQRQVFSAAYACPGLNLNELTRLTGLNPATVARQVRHLEQLGLLVSVVCTAVTNTGRLCRRICRLVRPAPWTVAA